MLRTANQPPRPLELGFASFQDGSFELVVRDPAKGAETTLEGRMKAGQLEQVDALLPTCCFVTVAPQPIAAASGHSVVEGAATPEERQARKQAAMREAEAEIHAILGRLENQENVRVESVRVLVGSCTFDVFVTGR